MPSVSAVVSLHCPCGLRPMLPSPTKRHGRDGHIIPMTTTLSFCLKECDGGAGVLPSSVLGVPLSVFSCTLPSWPVALPLLPGQGWKLPHSLPVLLGLCAQQGQPGAVSPLPLGHSQSWSSARPSNGHRATGHWGNPTQPCKGRGQHGHLWGTDTNIPPAMANTTTETGP